MIIDIHQSIVNYCNIHNQLKYVKLDKNTNDRVLIFSLKGTFKNNLYINCDILKQKKFNKLRIINCEYMPNIRNINNLAFLNETLEEIVYDEERNGIIDKSLFHNLKKLENNKIFVQNSKMFESSLQYFGNGVYGIAYTH